MRKSLITLFLSMVCIVTSGQVFAQTRPVTGTVTSAEDGSPIPGATIIAKGTNTGTVTNVNGAFSLNVPAGVSTLIVKFVGMKDMEIALTEATSYPVSLQADVRTLNETVVTANAIRREKSSLGYSAPTVKNDELTKGRSGSALNGLAGKVAGVNITSTASAPGSSSRIVLRGGSSITGNNQALIVVDGVPIDNSNIMGGGDSRSSVDFGNRGNDINPDDVESMTILKGPAAAALYGSRASNGAVIITTKSGKRNDNKKMEVTFNTTTTFSNVLKLPDFQNKFGQGGDFEPYPMENWSWGPEFDGVVTPWGQIINGEQLEKPYVAQKDNVKDFFELGTTLSNNLSLGGASEKSSYYLSLSSVNSDGVMPDNYDKFSKYGVRFNGSTQLTNKISSALSLNYSKINSNNIQGGQGDGSVYDNVIQTPRDIPLDKIGDLSNPFYSYGGLFDPEGNELYGYYGAYTKSPYYVLKNYKNQNDVDRITGNFTISYKPLAWLDVVERLGADIYTDRRRFKYPKFSLLPADTESGQYSDAFLSSSNGMYAENTYTLSEITHDLMVTAQHKFSEDFNASLMIGNNIRQRQFTQSEVSTNTANGLVIPGWYNFDNSNGPVDAFNYNSNRRLVGLYGELNLAYKSMLYLGVTARNDWSSTLPMKNRSFFYPSVNASFVFTELMKGSGFTDVLNYGKIRSSWASVGNDADPYLLASYYTKTDIAGGFGNTTFPFNNIPGFSLSDRIGNADLKPEKTQAFEVGAELGFFNSRVSVDFSYYQNRSKDQILNIPISSASGFSSKTINTGEVENRGVELSLRGTPVKTADFTWELYGTFTKNKSEVISLLDGVNQVVIGGFGGMSIVAAVGKPYGTFYATDLRKDAEGRVIVNPDNGLPLLSETPQYLGSYNPKWQGSIGTNLTWKGFNLGVLFDTKQGGKFFSRTKDVMDFVGTAEETAVNNREDHIFPNSVYLDGTGKSVTNTEYVYYVQDYFTNQIPAGQHVVDGSYVKLRELNLSYRIPKNVLARTFMGDASIGVFGNNLFIWTAGENKYADPEINSGGAGNEQGLDFTAQPSLRNFGFNLKISF